MNVAVDVWPRISDVILGSLSVSFSSINKFALFIVDFDYQFISYMFGLVETK